MTPHETNQVALQFTATASPWWLLLLVPAAVAVAWFLYRIDLPGLKRVSSVTLVALRCLLLAALVFLAFRPNLIHRRTLTYPGRVVFVADDSFSMTTRDAQLSDADALRLARGIGTKSSADDGPAEPMHAAAAHLEDIIQRLRKFQRYARDADRSRDVFWDRVAGAEAELTSKLDRIDELSDAAAGRFDDMPEGFETATDEAAALREGLGKFFAGERAPGAEAYARFYRRVDALAEQFRTFQAVLDNQQLAAGDEPLRRAIDQIRSTTRLELLKQQLGRLAATIPDLVPDQGFELAGLMSDDRLPLDDQSPSQLQPSPGETDLAGRLQAILDEPSEFPLSAIVLLSDGQDVVARPSVRLQQALTKKQIPLLAAGIGHSDEPIDVAVVELAAPPIAVVETPAAIRAQLRVSLARPLKARIDLLREGELVDTRDVELASSPSQWIELPITPAGEGLFRYTLRVQPIAGEVFPVENNSADFVLNVRPRTVNVLFLDYAPRWETRFALNVFRRLPYVQLNSMIVLSQPDAKLVRGAERGTWPENADALELYDLVVLGSLPPDLLTGAEWSALSQWVQHNGGTLCLLDPRGAGTNAVLMEQPDLWPMEAAAGTGTATTLGRIGELRLTRSGRIHPITAALTDDLGSADLPAVALRPMAQVLMTDSSTERSLVAWQLLGEGKTLLIDAKRLWMPLNPTAHHGHLEMFVQLVTWSVEGGWSAETTPARSASEETLPRLALDRRRILSDQEIQIIATGVQTGAKVEAVLDGETVAEAAFEPVARDSAICRSVFTGLPTGEILFQLRDDGDKQTQSVQIIDRNAELNHLALDELHLRNMAESTGGAYRGIDQLQRLLLEIEPKQRVERHERLWRLWDSAFVLALLITVLTIEWVWRKYAGRV